MNAKLYKLTAADGSPIHGGSGKWDLPKNGKPGKWRKVEGVLSPCRNGLHLMKSTQIFRWVREGVLWHVEAGKERVEHEGTKVVVRRARIIGEAAKVTKAIMVEFACDCVDHVLHLYESRYKDDNRPRLALEAARYYLAVMGTDHEEEAKKAAYAAADAAYAAAAAAYAAANAPYAAADAAYAAANAAAYAAANAAAYAAANAPYAAYAANTANTFEWQWQGNRLAELLGLEVEE